jgi:hypothetical protein
VLNDNTVVSDRDFLADQANDPVPLRNVDGTSAVRNLAEKMATVSPRDAIDSAIGWGQTGWSVPRRELFPLLLLY